MLRFKRFILMAVLATTPLTATAIDWEIKSDLNYTDGARSNQIKYDGGSFDERVVKKKRKTELKTVLVASFKPSIMGLDYQLRAGYNWEQNRDSEREYREDGSLKKDKSRTEYDRISFIGAGLNFKSDPFLGADLWRIKARYDRYFHIAYGASELREDAKARSGSLDGYEWKVKLEGEYSTPWISLYLLPRLEYKEERFGDWYNKGRDRREEAEKEQQYEAGLFLDWITPLDGWELRVGPYWQRELDAEKSLDDGNWDWEDDERWLVRIELEYESPLPGFELEFNVEQHLNGEDQTERKYNLELSYEF